MQLIILSCINALINASVEQVSFVKLSIKQFY